MAHVADIQAGLGDVEIPDDLLAAYAAEEKAETKVAAERAESVELRAAFDTQQAKVREARTPFEATRATRRTLERAYGIGEYADSGIAATPIGGD